MVLVTVVQLHYGSFQLLAPSRKNLMEVKKIVLDSRVSVCGHQADSEREVVDSHEFGKLDLVPTFVELHRHPHTCRIAIPQFIDLGFLDGRFDR
ncbi:hypothetical protein [Singulisphaera acidiphila]|uniref:hypothetical protein n=1 Tax=Singulisphaera acidiphila TaxID=466153 RepID=UPI001575366D|nr:hypothetical protein [Singulisphaera acidiphila]